MGTNDRPISIDEVEPIVMDEDQTLRGYDINSLFVDPDGDDLTFIFSEGKKIIMSISKSGNLSIQPIPNWHGSETIRITASDGEFSNSVHIMVIVQPVNDIPRLTSDQEKIIRITEDFKDYPIDPDNHFEDVDGDPVELKVASSPEIRVKYDTGGFIFITPKNDWYGMGWLAINCSDGK